MTINRLKMSNRKIDIGEILYSIYTLNWIVA